MTDYISFFSESEVNSIIETIGSENFKILFKKYPKQFNTIRPGATANKLSSEQTLKIVRKNANVPFIKDAINCVIVGWIKEVDMSISQLEKSGMSHDDAMAEALIDSHFVDLIHAYFKCMNISASEEEIDAFKTKIDVIVKKREADSNLNKKISELEAAVDKQKSEIDELHQTISDITESKDKQIAESDELLKKANERIAELENFEESSDSIITASDILARYNDSGVLDRFSFTDEKHYSLCTVSISYYSNELWLIRCADINDKGRIEAFYRDDTRPYLFGNRDKLFHKDGPSEKGAIGVWEWSALPNQSDSTKDYVITKYCNNIIPIEVAIFKDIFSLDGLIEALKTGVPFSPKSDRILLSVLSGEKYMGVLCDSKDVKIKDDMISLTDSVFQLPVYDFSDKDLITIGSSTRFLCKISCGIPKMVYRIKDTFSMVRSIIIDSISWNAYKQRGIYNSEYRNFKNLISMLPTEDIVKNIRSSCHCSTVSAEPRLKQFIEHASDYVDQENIDDEIIGAAIMGNAALSERAKMLASDEWKKENAKIINDSEKQIKLLEEKLSDLNKNVDAANEKLTGMKAEESALSKSISEKKKLADDVENIVSERIKRAKENAAEFIASMAFAGNNGNMSRDIVPSSEIDYELHKANISDDGSVHKNWTDVIDTASFELEEAGVSAKYSHCLAAYLCAAYILKQPMILVGPNAMDIAEAFSYSLFNGLFGIITYNGGDLKMPDKLGTDGEKIIVLKNFLTGNSVNNLPEFISDDEKLFLIIHPYPEDIQVEPKSIYSYLLPVFTEFFVDKTAGKKYEGGSFADGFKVYSSSGKGKHSFKFLSQMPMSMITKSRFKDMLTVVYDIYPELTTDGEFLLGALQYSYATLNTSHAISDICNSLSADFVRDLKSFLGETDE